MPAARALCCFAVTVSILLCAGLLIGIAYGIGSAYMRLNKPLPENILQTWATFGFGLCIIISIAGCIGAIWIGLLVWCNWPERIDASGNRDVGNVWAPFGGPEA
jgi:hypothetical protein